MGHSSWCLGGRISCITAFQKQPQTGRDRDGVIHCRDAKNAETVSVRSAECGVRNRVRAFLRRPLHLELGASSLTWRRASYFGWREFFRGSFSGRFRMRQNTRALIRWRWRRRCCGRRCNAWWEWTCCYGCCRGWERSLCGKWWMGDGRWEMGDGRWGEERAEVRRKGKKQKWGKQKAEIGKSNMELFHIRGSS